MRPSRTHYVRRSVEHDAVPPRLREEEEECEQPDHSHTALSLFTKTHPLYVADAHSSFDSDLCLSSSPTWQIFLTIAKNLICLLFVQCMKYTLIDEENKTAVSIF